MVSERARYRLLAPLWRRLRLILSRGVVRRSDTARGLQLTLLRGETREVEQMEPYGYTARPLAGAEAIVAAIGGARGHLVALTASDRRHRLRGLSQGEVALYTDEGDRIVLKRGRVIAVTASSRVTLDTPQTDATGNLTVEGLITGRGGMAISGGQGASVDGDLTTTGDTVAGGISLRSHVHGGVQPGGGETGGPK